jgi:quinoprotein glucose dehydrogenase
MQPEDALSRLRTVLESGSVSEQQAAFATIGTLPPGDADKVLLEWLGKLMEGGVKSEVTLDLLDAAGKRDAREVRAKIRDFENQRPSADDLRSYRECLVGGDAENGKKIFVEKAEASCVRCHKFHGEGGEVGPHLTGIGSRKDRQYILESIVFPNKQVAQGYDSVIVVTKSGSTYAGTLKSEAGDRLEINSPEDGLLSVKKAEIKLRERGLSAMPEELRQVLTKAELRDLVEFLSESKETKPEAK